MPKSLARWLRQSPMSEPGSGVDLYEALPRDIGGLCRAIEGLLIHADWTAAYGLSADHFGPEARTTLPIAQRLAQISRTDSRPLSIARPIEARVPGTCRDFALLLCSVLRHRQVPARVRCGFAAYFQNGSWEDHWICEQWLPAEERWRRIDAQLDDVQKRQLGVRFDTTDVPRAVFMTAGDAWRLCRSGAADAESFGQGLARGLWFVHVDVVRDHYALNESEVSPWDSWRQAHGPQQIISEPEQRATDSLAERPDAARTELTPPWLA
jgi:transglutaminase superfamily protein